jgi:hypothetical protein
MAFRLGKVSRASVTLGPAAAISALALLCVVAAPASAAPPSFPLPPVLHGPAFSATATSTPVGGGARRRSGPVISTATAGLTW